MSITVRARMPHSCTRTLLKAENMKSHDDKQHRRIVILTIALFCLSLVLLWQQSPILFSWQKDLQFAPGTTLFTLSVAVFVSMVAAVLFTRNSSRELKASAKLAFIDEMTGLANRRQFNVRLKQELSRAARNAGGVSVMYFDLDRFKEINDCYGHEVGDKTLIEFARRFQSVLRTEAFVARLGGDEFAAIVMDVDNVDALTKVADRLLQAMRQPFSFDNTDLYTSASIGASIICDGSLDADEAIRQADFALFQAKSDGRNCLKIFDPDMARLIAENRVIETDMREALLNGGFHVEYQPFLSQETHEIIGAEALLRWSHPKRGPLEPEEFIPIAERTGLIHELGEFVFKQACHDFRDLHAKKLAVNVSPVQFQHGDFVDNVRQILDETGFDPKRLEIEITEGIFISDPAKAAKVISKIQAMGVKVALDDFGTGYSSMSYLQDFKLDRIKIDRSFVTKLDETVESEKLISTMISLGESLELDVTVEGIETKEQLYKLKKYNCTELQGFLFSRSVAISQLQKLCIENNPPDFEPGNGLSAPRLSVVR